MKNKQISILKRVIVDFKKLNKEILNLLVEKYPDGYDDEDIITFKNRDNEVVECIEVRTTDTAYLVKISKRLVLAMEEHDIPSDNDDSSFEHKAFDGSEEE